MESDGEMADAPPFDKLSDEEVVIPEQPKPQKNTQLMRNTVSGGNGFYKPEKKLGAKK